MENDKHIKKFNQYKENLNISDKDWDWVDEEDNPHKIKKNEYGDLIEELTIGDFINILKKYKPEDKICFSYNSDQCFIGVDKNDENFNKVLTKWNKKSNNWFLELIYY